MGSCQGRGWPTSCSSSSCPHGILLPVGNTAIDSLWNASQMSPGSSPQVSRLEEAILEKLPKYDGLDQAAAAVREWIEALGVPFDAQKQAELAEALENVRATLKDVEILRRVSLTKVREAWYRGPRLEDRHWPALRGYLRNTKDWTESSIASIDDSSSEVVSLLANPAKDQFRCRGLVVGYVQSGKTANMTAVMAKAIDAGYNLVVLLGGVTNKLRAQTQGRIHLDVVQRHRERWLLYTTAEDEGDFVYPSNGSFIMPAPGGAQLVVMKKITSRLEAFSRTVTDTPASILRNLKVLLIDDECDQASVNSSGRDYDMTRINEEIRKIIRALPAVSYVGYTATPFANVFIDPFPHNKHELDDLYPEDFITALPRPEGYFGAVEVFGSDPVDSDHETEEEAGRDMIRIIPEETLDLLRPEKVNQREGFFPEVTPELHEALLWFLGSCAIRRRRGHADKHMTMLIHTSPNVNQHERMAVLVKAWLEEHSPGLASGEGVLFEEFCEVVEREQARVPGPAHPDPKEAPKELLPHLQDALDALKVVVENGVSDDRLDYSQPPKTYIVIGGSVLARGLTLEGLSVSFFLRTSRQYDTLLQMGRWFGFRPGYDDLPRLWTTASLAGDFRSLARIEAEIREDIEVYRLRSASPLDFAVKVRSIPGMAITSASKMKAALRTSISFEGRHVQTIRFDHKDPEIVGRNWAAAARLVDGARNWLTDGRTGHQLFEGVPLHLIRRFLSDYHICKAHMDLRPDHLLGYLDEVGTGLEAWNVGCVTPVKGIESLNPLGFFGKVRTNVRSRLKNDSVGFADIKALMSKRDILLDVTDQTAVTGSSKWEELKALRPSVPLLLLYPINHASNPRASPPPPGGGRQALNAVGDLVGLGIVFPGTRDRGGDYFAVELDPPTPEQVDQEEFGPDEGLERDVMHG